MEHEADYPDGTRGDWIQTFSGTKFHFWSNDASEVQLVDVARGLSQTARWRGQYKSGVEFYSVAQHCVHASRIAPVYAKKYALLHDAAEWPLGDMPKPIKCWLPDYKKLEGFLLSKICNRFKVPVSPRILSTVKTIDNWLLFTEGEQLLTRPALIAEWGLPRLDCKWAPEKFRIRPWGPDRAMHEFLQQFKEVWNTDA
jgi:hypothetical protein